MAYQVNIIYKPIIALVDAIGTLIFLKNKFKKEPQKLKKALFIRLEHIGDMVMATAAFESFKKSNPNCEIHVLCKTLTAPLIENNPSISKIITYDAPWFASRREDKKKSLGEIINSLRKEQYDIVFEMHGDPRNNYLAYKTGAYAVGYACRGGGFFLNKTMPYNQEKWMVEQNISLVKDFSKKTTTETKLVVGKKHITMAETILNKYKLKKKEFIIINPVSGRPEKDLTSKETVSFINKYNRMKVVITGSKSEIEKNKSFEQHKNVINLTGKTDLMTLVALTGMAKKVIAPDTGIVHIAHAVKTPCEAIYKTTNQNVWGYK